MKRGQLVHLKNKLISILPDFMTKALNKLLKSLFKIGLTVVPYKYREDTMFSNIYTIKELGFKPKYVIDVGAFEGSWTVEASKIFHDSRFIMIEPQESKKEILNNICNRNDQFTYISALLSSKPKEVEFYELETGSSIYKQKTENPGIVKVKTTQTLDALIDDNNVDGPIFLKMDVQGSELDILEGTKKSLGKIEFILLEASLVEYNEGAPKIIEVINYMKSINYILFDICDDHRNLQNQLIQVDLLFIKENSKYLSFA